MAGLRGVSTPAAYLSLHTAQSNINLGEERERGRSHSASLPWGLFWKTENYDSVSLPPDNNETLAPVAFKVSKEDRKMLLTPGNGLMGRVFGVFLGHRCGWCHAGC